MEPVKCALCLYNCSPGIKHAENLLNSNGIEAFPQAEKDIPVKHQLQIILLLRKILEVPQEKCCDFLRDYGDPCSWINCCDSCSTLVGKCRIISDQIIKLQKQFEHLQTEIRNIIIRSAKDEEANDEFDWGGGVQGEMRSFIIKGLYQANLIKEEFAGELPCHNITINDEIVSESILGCFPEEIEDSLIEVKNGFSTYLTNSFLSDNCDSEEQDPPRGIYKEGDSDNQQDIQNAKVMSKRRYFQSKTNTLGTHFVSHLPECHPENSISTSSNALMHTEDKTFQCNICGERFSELGLLHDHICIPTETKLFTNEGFSGASNLEGPGNIHSEENSYIFTQDFNNPQDVNDHIVSTQPPNNSMDRQYNCVVCGRCFSNISSLQKHGPIHSGKQCNVCEKLFTNSEDFIDHMQTHTKDGSSQTKHKCEFCGKCFRENGNLINHQRSHQTREKRYRCTFCKKTFGYPSDLERHESIHTADSKKPYKCRFCEKTFSQSGRLNIHERVHTGEKPYKCQFCEKSFHRSDHFKQHERIHTGEKPYKCQFCEKSFHRSDQFKQHERIHTGEIPYKCQFCEKSFHRSDHLKQHEKIHIGEKPYKCQICEKSFSVSQNLKHHESTHCGKKPYKCQICEKSFPRSDNLKRHERIHIGEEPYKALQSSLSKLKTA